MAEKKFKPIAPQDLTGELKEKVQFIEGQWMHHPVVKNFHGRWKEYIAWFEGNQYTVYIPSSGKLLDISDKVDREKKNVYNRILPMIRQMWGEIRYPHSFYVEPNTTEAEDIKGAKIGSSIIQCTNRNTYRKFNAKINRAKLWALITGNVFWKEFWNKNLFGLSKNKTGETVKEPGNVDFSFINPFNVRPDPFGNCREEWRWFIEGKRIPKYIVEQEFGLKPGSLPMETLEGADTGLFERAGIEKPKEDTTIRIEYHERPSEGRKEGRFMVVAGGWLLYDGSNDSPEHDIPQFHIPGILPILNEQWYDSAVRIAQDPQRNFNRLGSRVDEHIENFRLKALVPKGSLSSGEFERYTRSGVDWVIINPGVAPPHWQSPPNLPEIIMRWLNFMENEIETESSVRKVSFGQLPQYAQRASGVLFEGLKRQDETVLIPTVDDINTSLEDAMSFRLKLVQKHYSIPRLIKTTGRDERMSIIFAKKEDLRDNTDVHVVSGVELFSDKIAKREVVMKFVDKGMIAEPRKALELLSMEKGLEEYYEEEFIDERQAYREIELLHEGKITPKVSADDNHEVHYRIHNNERKKEEFNTWDDDAKKRLLDHIEEHKPYLGMEEGEGKPMPEGEEVAMGAEAPAEGMPAPATPSPEQIMAKILKPGGA